jgi:hypothetical protein
MTRHRTYQHVRLFRENVPGRWKLRASGGTDLTLPVWVAEDLDLCGVLDWLSLLPSRYIYGADGDWTVISTDGQRSATLRRKVEIEEVPLRRVEGLWRLERESGVPLLGTVNLGETLAARLAEGWRIRTYVEHAGADPEVVLYCVLTPNALDDS